MELFEQISTIIIYCGAFFAFVMALGQIAGRHRNIINIIGFFALLCNAVFNLNIAFFPGDIQLAYPPVSLFFITSLYLSGPVNYLYYKALTEDWKPVPGKTVPHLLLPFFALVIEILFHLMPMEKQRVLIAAAIDPETINYIKLAIITGVISILVYHSRMTRGIIMLWNNKRVRPEATAVITLNGSGIIAAIVLIAGFLSGIMPLLLSGGLIFVGVNLMVFLFHVRNPEFFLILRKEIRDQKYRKNMLYGLDINALHSQLLSVMEEGLYRDCDLTLSGLADILRVSPHALSQLLNERLNTTFRDFINSYRIDEAKCLLRSDEDSNVLSICFHVGFNSKSAFNAAFRKHTGSVPKSYRSRKNRPPFAS